MRRILLIATMAWLSALGTHAVAETANDPTELTDSIVVTANRFGQSPKQAIWPATALSRQTLSTDVSLQQSLDGRFGLDLRQTSGVGSIATLSNWGTFNRHMLLLYNGRVVRDYSLGGFNLSDFSADEFERIELLKGPQSAFYGADAIGGVINLISRNALVDRVDVVTRYGEHDLRQYRLDASKLLGTIGIGGFAEFSKAENNRPNAGSERILFGLRSDYLSHSGIHRVSMSARYFEDSLGAPGPVPDPVAIPVYGNRDASSLNDHQQDDNYSADLTYRYSPNPSSELQVDLFWEKKNLDYHSLYNYQFSYYTPEGADSVLNVDSVDVHSRSIYNKRSAGLSGRYQHHFKIVTASLGMDILSGSLRATSDDRSFGTNTVGPFAPYQYDYSNFNFWSRGQEQIDFWGSAVIMPSAAYQYDLSGRVQFVHNRKAQPSFNAGIMFSSKPYLRFKLGYGYAFRLPSIADQFADEIYVQGRADLEPETSHSVVGSIEYDALNGNMTLRMSGFAQQVRSLIQYQYDPNIFRSVPQNISRFRSSGIDASITYRLPADYWATLGMVYQQARQTTLPGDYVNAYYVPDLKWRADWGGTVFPRLSAGFNLSYTSDREIMLYGGEAKSIDAVYELGATLAYAISKQATFSLTGYDLTDRRRPDQFGFVTTDGDYPTPGRRLVAQFAIKLR
ncbi:MAG: TonB-dependent receptor [bacterium]|nr:TonB-dependent receptor [bacterium]